MVFCDRTRDIRLFEARQLPREQRTRIFLATARGHSE